MLLLRFLDEIYPQAAPDEQRAFEVLLEAQDPELAAWIRGDAAPPNQCRGVVERIRKFGVRGS